ncbi:hypothetical protein L2E82_51946 [Cichorium intybus]|nr:hypothetical protein L2E82_51946 [Cichorium intybus]
MLPQVQISLILLLISSTINQSFANSNPDMPAAPVHASQERILDSCRTVLRTSGVAFHDDCGYEVFG